MKSATQPRPDPSTPEAEAPKKRRTPIEKAIDGLRERRARVLARETAALAKVKAKYASELSVIDAQIEKLKEIG